MRPDHKFLRCRTAVFAVAMATALTCLMAGYPDPAQAAQLTESWLSVPGGSIDGMSLGDINGDGRDEAVIISRGGWYAPGEFTAGTGTLATVQVSTGSVLWQQQGSKDLAGSPTLADFDGDGLDEIALCEIGSSANCRVYDGDGTLMFSSGALWYPGMTNGGPAAADLNGDGFADLVVIDYGGHVTALAGPMGTTLWRKDLWADFGELLFTAPVLADLDGDGTLELILVGYNNGGMYCFNASTGALRWAVPSVSGLVANPRPGNSGFFIGSIPAVADLTGDGTSEIVATMAGVAVSSTVIFNASGSLLSWTELPGTDLAYTSPAIADLEQDGIPEIVVQSLDGTLLVLNANGSIREQRSVGSGSWSNPAFIDADLDGDLEIVATGLSTVYILDEPGLVEVDRFDNPAAGMYPAPVYSDADGDGKIEMISAAWFPQQLYGIDLNYVSTFGWKSLAGSASHPGSVNGEDRLPHNPAITLQVAVLDLSTLLATPGLSSGAKNKLNSALSSLVSGWNTYMQGNPHTALSKLSSAASSLRSAMRKYGVDTTALQDAVLRAALLVFEQYLDRNLILYGSNDNTMKSMETSLASAWNSYNQGNFSSGMSTLSSAGSTLRNYLDNTPPKGDFCPVVQPRTTDFYFYQQCRLHSIWVDLVALTVQYPNDTNLVNGAHNLMFSGIWWLPDLNFSDGATHIQSAEANLAAVTSTDVTFYRQEITLIFSNDLRRYIDDATYRLGAGSTAIVDANNLFNQAETARLSGSYASALGLYSDAYLAARP